MITLTSLKALSHWHLSDVHLIHVPSDAHWIAFTFINQPCEFGSGDDGACAYHIVSPHLLFTHQTMATVEEALFVCVSGYVDDSTHMPLPQA